MCSSDLALSLLEELYRMKDKSNAASACILGADLPNLHFAVYIMRTPLIMRLPKGFDRKGDITEMVQNIDYAPTFLELAGVPVPEDIHGVSLLPLLEGEHPQNWRNALYYHFYEYPAEHMVKRHYGVLTDRYKLIYFYNDIDMWELYDLQSDPMEMHNLYGQAEYEPVVKELKEELLKLQEQYNDPVRFSPDRDKE